MTFRIDKIEIQQQPERKRYWAEVEVLTPSGFRRKRIETPEADGHWGLLNAIGAYCDEYAPKPAAEPRDDIAHHVSVPKGASIADVREDDPRINYAMKRGPGRPRKEVATLGDAWPASDEP